MTITTHSMHDTRKRQVVKNRLAAVLMLAVSLVTTFGLIGETRGQAGLPRVGVLTFLAVADEPELEATLELFRRTLADRGWVEGKNVAFEYRNAYGDPTRIAEAAEALVKLKVDVIFALSAPSLRAAHAATRTIPIVGWDYTTDPIVEGYIQSYARPGGNVTGVFLDAPEVAGKWFELLKAMLPGLSRVSVLWDPAPGGTHLQAVRGVATSLDIKLQILEVRKPGDIDMAFSALRGPPQALVILPSPMTWAQSARLARLALKHRLPATSFSRAFAIAGGALAYGPGNTSALESIAVLVAKILAGSDPAELPVERPTKIQLVVNLKTARALGITIPQSILIRADEVIR